MEQYQPFDHSFHILYFYQSISKSFKNKVCEKKKSFIPKIKLIKEKKKLIILGIIFLHIY